MNLVKLQDTKLMHRNLLHSYALTMKDQKEKLRKQSHLLSQQKGLQYLGINLPKEAKDLYAENYKILMKEIKQMERCTGFLDWKNQYCKNDSTTQSNLQIQCNLYQITNSIFHRIE